jgi:hypothetical protein
MPEFFANWVNSVLKLIVIKLSIQTNVKSHDEESKRKNVKSVSRANASLRRLNYACRRLQN